MKRILGSLILIFVLALNLMPVAAQDDDTGTPIEFSGTVEAITATTITVSGVTVDISSLDSSVVSVLETGMVITIDGNLEGTVVIAITVVLPDGVQPEATEVPDDDDDTPTDTDGGILLNTFIVTYGGSSFDGTNTTFTYIVTGTGESPDLSHFDVGIPTCPEALVVVAYSPTDAFSTGVDPTTGVDGAKWDMPLGVNSSRTYSITFAGSVAVGSITVAVKDGDGSFLGTLPGPSCEEALITVQTFISRDGGTTWTSADSAPGLEVPVDTDSILVRFVATNTGTAALTGINLTGTSYDTSTCTVPATLEAGASFDCTVELTTIGTGQQSVVTTVTGTLNGTAESASDTAFYFVGDLDDDDDDGIVIVIEGPVTSIEGTTIVIFGFNIVLADDDPLITVIQIGDFLRIEGNWDDDNPIIIAIIIIFIDIDVFVFDGLVWRDQGNCNNAPPPWAPANGWRRRCETPRGGGSGSGRGRSGGSSGRGRSGGS
jgi:hypothetical protein